MTGLPDSKSTNTPNACAYTNSSLHKTKPLNEAKNAPPNPENCLRSAELGITVVIMKITWDSWRTVARTDPGEMVDQ